MTDTLTLTDFLLARIAEDEAQASGVERHESMGRGLRGLWVTDRDGERTMILCADPDRVLAECEARRRIAERVADDMALYDHVFTTIQPTDAEDYTNGAVWGLRYALRQLATVYDDHPDYQEEWRP